MELQITFKDKATLAFLVSGSLAAGVLNGLIGTGGGIILTYVFSFLLSDGKHSSKDVFVTAMASILPISLFSLLSYRADVIRDMSYVIPTALSAAAGGIIGAVIGTRVRPVVLEKLFSVIVIWAGINMIFRGIK